MRKRKREEDTYVYVCIYLYIERERERDKERERRGEADMTIWKSKRMGKISDIISSELTKSTMSDNVCHTRIRAGW